MVKEKIAKKGSTLTTAEIGEVVREAISDLDLEGKKVLTIIPDSTRTAPIPLFYELFCEHIGPRAETLDFMIALGTHPPMSEEQINRLVGTEKRCGQIFNHRWNDPDQIKEIGKIDADEIEELSGDRFREEVTVTINRRIFDYDLLLVTAPTFPHEVVGFSGGNKYFFPGISGPQILNFFHWLGAVITNPVINGKKRTPVRDVIDKAASMIDVPRICFSMVVTGDSLRGLFVGSPEEAYSRAADLSSEEHIVYREKPFKKVLAVCPEMYDDLWTGGKCMYKLEPVVEDGGELIIYAPHITEVSYSHGELLDKIGYHTCEYFLKQMDKFEDIPRGVLAHSTHVKGAGTYEDGVEKPRITVTLATGIPEERCETINLGYRDPETIDPEDYRDREDEGILLVEKAGEMLYRLK